MLEILTEPKQAEDALKASRRYLRAIFDNSLDAIVVTNDEGRYVDANPAACKLLGYTLDELLELSFLDLTEPSLRQAGGAMWEQFLNTGSISGEFSMLRKDGTIIQLEFRAVANILPGVHVSSSRDITERKRAEEAQRNAEQKYRDIFENAVEGIFQTTPEGRFVAANPALARMFGFDSPEELIKERADISKQHYVDPELREEFKRRLAEEGVVHNFEYEGYRKDGSKIWVSDIVRAVRDSDGTLLYYQGTTHDITERKHAEEALRDSEERYRKLAENFPNGAVITYDRDFRVTFIAGRDLEETGVSADLFMGNLFDEIAPPEVVALVKPHFRAAFEGQTEIYECPFPDGRLYFAAVAPLFDENGLISEILVITQNITAPRRAEKALREAERKYRDIFENAGEGIFQSTPDGRYIAANPVLAQMYGFACPEELILSCQDISRQIYVDPTRRDEFKRQLKEQGSIRGFEHQVFRKDGSNLWVSVNARAVRDEKGAIQYYEGTAQDINERKRAEEALRDSEERYRELFENGKDATYVHDLNGRYTSVNRAAEKLSGRSREEIIGRRFSDFIPPDQFEVASEHLCKKLAQEGETTYETELVTRDGRRVPVEVSSHLIYENGIGVAVQGTARDITERKRAEERLREYEKVVEGLEEMIVVVDRDFRYQLANQSFLKYRRKTREQVLGRLVSEVVGTKLFEGVIKKNLELSFRGQVVTYELATPYPELGVRNMLVSLIPIEGPTGIDRTACVLKDITESKQAEEALQRYPRQLIEAQETERKHIARELHDQVGQVLTAIRINLQSIGSSTADPDSLIDQGVALIDAALEQVRNLSFELRPSLLDNLGLEAALRWYCDQFTQRTGITARSTRNLPGGYARLGNELETACFRIVQEALTNVARHAKAKNVSVKLSAVDHRITLSIKDDGIGFDAPPPKDGGPSSSLGLRGMRERALALGGTFEIESRPTKGTEIRACFPNGSKKD